MPPTLLVCGRRDDLVPLHECDRLAAIPGAQLVVLDASGHALEEINQIGSLLQPFLRDRATTGS
jgi:pimeloyl-ACP methyl ester carboxylesterase